LVLRSAFRAEYHLPLCPMSIEKEREKWVNVLQALLLVLVDLSEQLLKLLGQTVDFSLCTA